LMPCQLFVPEEEAESVDLNPAVLHDFDGDPVSGSDWLC